MRRIWSARRGPVVYVSACLLIAGLAGCRGDDPGPAAPTTMHPGTAVTPTSSTPTGDPTDIAAAAAIAAVQKLYADFQAMTVSGSSQGYRRDFTRACSACAANARFVDGLTRRGQRLVGSGFSVEGLKVVWNKPNVVLVQGRLSHPDFMIRGGGTVKGKIRALPVTAFAWRVVPVQDSWLIASAEALK